jgi:hypothetical protein
MADAAAGVGSDLPPPPPSSVQQAPAPKKKDVRRPDLVQDLDYKWAIAVDDSVYEFATIIAMVAGMAGVMFRVWTLLFSLFLFFPF